MAQTIVGRVKTIIEADNSALISKIKESKTALLNFSNTSITAKIDLDTSAVKQKIAELQSKTITISVVPKIGQSKEELQRQKSFSQLFEGFKAKEIPQMPKPKLATDELKESITKIKPEINVKLVSNISDLKKSLDNIKSKTISLSAKDTITPKVEAIVTSLQTLKSKNTFELILIYDPINKN